jgi:hypothetical protein
VNRRTPSATAYNPLEWLLEPLLGSDTNLVHMRRTTEALRDRPALLRSALSVVRSDEHALEVVASRSSIHHNGFAKVVLSRGAGWSLRLHVWTPWIQSQDVNPHGHRWAFASWIITGTLRETRFDVAHQGRQFHRYAYRGSASGDAAAWNTGTVSLVKVEEVERVAGTVYQRTGFEVHTAQPCTDLVATLVLHGDSGKTTEVFKRPGEPIEKGEKPLSGAELATLLDEVVAALR